MRCEACGYYYYEMEENGVVEVIKGDEKFIQLLIPFNQNKAEFPHLLAWRRWGDECFIL